MATRLFKIHGEFCASHPWEVIVATLTMTACILTIEQQNSSTDNVQPKAINRYCDGCLYEAEYNASDVIVMTFIRCLAVLYSYYQFRNLHNLGSKYILGIAGLFTVFSSFVFTTTMMNFLGSDVNDLKDALFFFLLLIDLSKAAMLAENALKASDQEQVKKNIANGIAAMGPAITLDTIVETLLIGVGTLSKVQRLEMLSRYACLSVLVNYVVFMTFYPACLSLILELSRGHSSYAKKMGSFYKEVEYEKSNPVVQRVKLIMSVGLMLVHVHSRWPFREEGLEPVVPLEISNRTEETNTQGYIMKWIVLSVDNIVILIVLLALVVKFIFFDNQQLAEQIQISSYNSYLESSKLLATRSSTKDEEKKTKAALEDKEIQTEEEALPKEERNDFDDKTLRKKRTLEECVRIYKLKDASNLSDEEVMMLVNHNCLTPYQLEKAVKNPERGVEIRRKLISTQGNFGEEMDPLPYKNYDYTKIMGACCENVIGYMPVPVGIAGPLLLDGRLIHIPLATTEGCLVASTNRGCRALLHCGVNSRIVADGMTRGPVVRFNSMVRASEVMAWMETPSNFALMKEQFDKTSRFARLKKIQIRIAGRYLFIRFVAKTGDAMGMNMLSKGTEASLQFVQRLFPDMEMISLSGNFCTDKKPAAVNWIEGRGKSVVCESIVPASTVRSILKTSVSTLVDLNISKNMMGSAMAGSIGGFNAHASNLVTAIFIATGQDPAQNVTSSNCITLMEPWGEHGLDLYITCTMPSIEVGTIGGGTILPAQSACLEILGVKGPNDEEPGKNADQLAKIVCGTVLAGELSLMSALAAGHLVRSHMKHNRSTTSLWGDSSSGSFPDSTEMPPPGSPKVVTSSNSPQPTHSSSEEI